MVKLGLLSRLPIPLKTFPIAAQQLQLVLLQGEQSLTALKSNCTAEPVLGQKPWLVHTCSTVVPNLCLLPLTPLEVLVTRSCTLKSPITRLTFSEIVGLLTTRKAALCLRKCPKLCGEASLERVHNALIHTRLPFLQSALTARQRLGRQVPLIPS